MDPSKLETYLSDPKTRKFLLKAKRKIHNNPYLKNKFYDTVPLTHVTFKKNAPSIYKKGILRSYAGKGEFSDVGAYAKSGAIKNKDISLVYTKHQKDI